MTEKAVPGQLQTKSTSQPPAAQRGDQALAGRGCRAGEDAEERRRQEAGQRTLVAAGQEAGCKARSGSGREPDPRPQSPGRPTGLRARKGAARQRRGPCPRAGRAEGAGSRSRSRSHSRGGRAERGAVCAARPRLITQRPRQEAAAGGGERGAGAAAPVGLGPGCGQRQRGRGEAGRGAGSGRAGPGALFTAPSGRSGPGGSGAAGPGRPGGLPVCPRCRGVPRGARRGGAGRVMAGPLCWCARRGCGLLLLLPPERGAPARPVRPLLPAPALGGGAAGEEGGCSRVSAASGVKCRDLALKKPLEAANAALAWGSCSGCKGLGQVGSVFDSPFHLSGKRTEQSRCTL